jgi:hypothetical protein
MRYHNVDNAGLLVVHNGNGRGGKEMYRIVDVETFKGPKPGAGVCEQKFYFCKSFGVYVMGKYIKMTGGGFSQIQIENNIYNICEENEAVEVIARIEAARD